MGLLGASGYGGGELLRLLKAHPGVELVGFSSRKHQGKPLAAAWPQLWDERPFASQEEVLERSEVVFLALPNGLAMEIAPRALAMGKRVIDLSGDFRLPPGVYEAWYGIPHQSPTLYREAIYGLPELHREEIREARLVANPGCYVTAATLALAPLAAAGALKGAFVVGLSGVSGAGREGEGTFYAEVNENLKPYRVGGTHRHIPEMERNLGRLLAQGRPVRTHGEAGEVRLAFTPHLVPMTRGILVTAEAEVEGDWRQEVLDELYGDFYAREPFVRVLREALPETKGTYGSNRVDLKPLYEARTGRVLVFAALDNLVKGMAGQAVQNLNLMMGFPEETALPKEGLWP
ncbi:N-acetyl-gamma-glutamyl-phosphate reductase [Thermus thermamylovorans]|uniref:N-acetyl-gamma-glutamyl-phosphate reductase n=1 Tax=Thermus thermamylovorans TaxID=2509362 RepID=A0A4Q9B743_9DEIN|nr:N-acetyl-gamma-glutamyl-phosphate reductase [Thermus thermamylovorans]TBH21955.1 N-acetyl-gamma-glutamyl-phosphate reductase [Thermus thermamylovorans]